MQNSDVTMGVFDDHHTVERAVHALRKIGLGNADLSVIGRAYSLEEKSVGLHARGGGPMTVWGERGLFWSTLWREFSGGVMLSVPFLGSVVILGRLADVVVRAVDQARLISNLSPLGSTLFSIGLSSSNIADYEHAVMADGFLACVSCTGEQLEITRRVFSELSAKCATTHVSSDTRCTCVVSEPAALT